MTRGHLALLVAVSLWLPSAHAQVPADPYNYGRASSFTYRADGLLESETIEPDNVASCVVTSYTYDAYGNKKTGTTANCAGASGRAVFPSRDASTEHAPATPPTVSIGGAGVTIPKGMFPITSTNALGQAESKEYDPRFGTVTKLTGPNGLVTRWEYDDLSRLTKEIRADDTSTVSFYCYVNGSGLDASTNTAGCPTPAANEAPAAAVMFVHTEPRNASGAKMGPFARAYKDAMSRTVRSVTESFDGAAQPAATRGVLVVQDTAFNTYGAKILTTQRYFLDSGSSTTTGTSDVGMSLMVFDVLGRPTTVYSADPNGSQASIDFAGRGARRASRSTVAYNGLETTTTNDKGQTRKDEKSVDGKLVRVTDAQGAQIAYQHDAFGNLIQTKDALQNSVIVKFDIRGRKVEMNDPDTGLWQYDYNALGELVWQQNPTQRAAADAGTRQTTVAYDKLGRITQRVDPEYTSAWSYDRYADGSPCSQGVGKLCEVTTNHGINRRLVFDGLGRPINTRTSINGGPSFAAAVSYDSATGRVASQTYPTGLSVNYQYTGLGVLEKLALATQGTVNPLPSSPGGTPPGGTTLAAGTVLWQAQVANAMGKLEQQIYGNGVVTKAVYEATTGRATDITAGTGTSTSVLNHHYVWDSLNNLVQRNDANGDGNTGAVTETFAYGDSINRLTGYTVAAPAIPNLSRTVTLQYNALGMLLYKSDVGAYTYGASGAGSVRPHALASMTSASYGSVTSYTYDANGNLTSASAGKYRSLSYTSFNLPDSQIGVQGPGGTPQYTWQYDENHARIKEVRTIVGGTMAGTRTTWKLHPDNAGGLGFESEVNSPNSPSASNPAITSNRHYLSAGGVSIGVLVSTGSLPSLASDQTAPAPLSAITLVKVEYWHKDHLGSLAATTDHVGNVTARYAYDPFGKRRYTNGSYDEFGNVVVDWSSATNAGTDRGYTGHEHLDDIGLIHMNGRIFDPTLGVFLQGDPMIQDPGNLQNYNRYAYCYNNPLTCTDPTGYFSLRRWFQTGTRGTFVPTLHSAFNHLREQPGQAQVDRYILSHPWANSLGQVVATVFTAWCGGCGGYMWSMYYTYQATGSMTSAYRGAAISYVTNMAFNAVGTATNGHNVTSDYFLEPEHFLNMAGHALVGCASAAVSGGDCKSQALASAFQSFVAPISPSGRAGLVVAMVVGGTVSEIAGDKFANGALTAAMGYLFNNLNSNDLGKFFHETAEREWLRGMPGELLDGAVVRRELTVMVGNDSGRIDSALINDRLKYIEHLECKCNAGADWTDFQKKHADALQTGNFRVTGHPGIDPNKTLNEQGWHAQRRLYFNYTARRVTQGKTYQRLKASGNLLVDFIFFLVP